jgi:hypothetical protein
MFIQVLDDTGYSVVIVHEPSLPPGNLRFHPVLAAVRTARFDSPVERAQAMLMPMKRDDKNANDFLAIARAGTAISFGLLAASLQSFRPGASGLSFQVSAATFLAFALGAAAGIFYWSAVLKSSRSGRQRSVLLVVSSIVLFAGSAAAFLYPLRFVSADKLKEISIGLGAALLVLSCVGYILWIITRFLNRDMQADEMEAKKRSRPD